MTWFEQLTGFKEADYATTQSRLKLEGSTLVSLANGRRFGIGHFEMVSLAELRTRVANGSGARGRARVSLVSGDVRQMHRQAEYAGALFQVASQFNALEMVGPNITPEDGVTRYAHDRTQGPACAIAAGAATLYRNYFVPVGDQIGQTAARQLDGLADLGLALGTRLGMPVSALWDWQNGYALCSREGLARIAAHLREIGPGQAHALAGALRIGVHTDVEVTEAEPLPGPRVSQAFCSALPVAYGQVPEPLWEDFARLVLAAAYEATMLQAVINARRGASNKVLLTLLGGGAFGNAPAWIHDAIRRAVAVVRDADLDVRVVSYGAPALALREMVRGIVEGGAA